jgi:hypothetical protein
VLSAGILAFVLSGGEVSAQTSYVIETVAVEGDVVEGTPLPPLAADFYSGYAVMSESGDVAFAGFPDPTDRFRAGLYTTSRVVAEPGDVIAGLTIDGVYVFLRDLGFSQERLAFDVFTYEPIHIAVVRESAAGLERLMGTGDLLPDEFGSLVSALVANLGGINDLGDAGLFAGLDTPENSNGIYELDFYVRYEMPGGPELLRLDADGRLFGTPRVMNNRDVVYDTGSGIDRYVFDTEITETVILEQSVIEDKLIRKIENTGISLGTDSQPGNIVFGATYQDATGYHIGVFSPTSLIVSAGDMVDGKTLETAGLSTLAPAVNDDGVVAFGAGYREAGQQGSGLFSHDGEGLSAVAVSGTTTNDGRSLVEAAIALGTTITSQGYIPFAATFTEDGGATTSTGIFVARPITDSTILADVLVPRRGLRTSARVKLNRCRGACTETVTIKATNDGPDPAPVAYEVTADSEDVVLSGACAGESDPIGSGKTVNLRGCEATYETTGSYVLTLAISVAGGLDPDITNNGAAIPVDVVN